MFFRIVFIYTYLDAAAIHNGTDSDRPQSTTLGKVIKVAFKSGVLIIIIFES